MERLRERLAVAEKAFSRFEEVMTLHDLTDLERDAAIQRFEFTFEAIWKAAKEFLVVQEGIDVGSPKGVIRSCREVGLFDDDEAVVALMMADDRNLSMHTYNEPLALEIYGHLEGYCLLMKKWLARMQKAASNN